MHKQFERAPISCGSLVRWRMPHANPMTVDKIEGESISLRGKRSPPDLAWPPQVEAGVSCPDYGNRACFSN